MYSHALSKSAPAVVPGTPILTVTVSSFLTDTVGMMHSFNPSNMTGPPGPDGRGAGSPSKMVVLTPYRDRADNLAKLVPHLRARLKGQGIRHHIAVIEQAGQA